MAGREMRWEMAQADKEIVRKLQKDLQIHPVLCELLVERGIRNFEEAKAFFRPSLSQLHDPFLMKDMNLAVDRLQRALDENKKILIYGDYDVDGTTSVSLVYGFLRTHTGKPELLDYYIPDRYREGYGVSKQGIEYAIEREVDLIVALDCGIKALEQVQMAKDSGIDFVVCDHHLPGPELPNAVAILDPKREDCPYPYKELCGCGIGFKLLQAWTGKAGIDVAHLYRQLDMVAVAIAADIVPITGENRILATFGIQQLEQQPSLGLAALLEKAGCAKLDRPLTVMDIVFGLAPRINAAGRMDDAGAAVRMLLADDNALADEHAEELHRRNDQRKQADKQITLEALDIMESWPDLDQRVSTVVFKEDWHKGVIGIVASRLIEHHHRPTIVLTGTGPIVTGSARSVPGFDIHTAISSCQDLLDRFGGHKYAAGLSIAREKVPEFRRRFEEVVRRTIDPQLLIPMIRIDAELPLDSIRPPFFKILRQFAPFGPGNRSPIFRSSNVVDTGWSRIVGENHLKLSVRQPGSSVVDGIAFGCASEYEKIRAGKSFDLAYSLEENTWKGRTTLQMKVRAFKR